MTVIELIDILMTCDPSWTIQTMDDNDTRHDLVAGAFPHPEDGIVTIY